MPEKTRHFETTRIEVLNNDTETILDSSPDLLGNLSVPSTKELRERYDAIIRQEAIYYPVAYRLVRELGRGRQGIVFMSLRQGARGCITRHAIKLFDPMLYSNTKHYWTDMGRLAAQISRLQTVRSPNLVARDVYQETNGVGYIQMEPIDGIDLRYLLTAEHLDPVRERSTEHEWAQFTDAIFRLEHGKLSIQPGIALYIMRQVLRGLETLHEMDFVHSDVKPANIMIDRLGYVKLVDYGRAVRAHEHVTVLFGSPLYMAPETHRREPSLVQSDIYGVGLVGLEMLRGEPLVNAKGMTEKDLLDFKMNLPAKLPDMLPEHVRKNEQLVHTMRRFIEPDPTKRFHTAEDAEAGKEGLSLVHRQLARLGKDTEYGRELQRYLNKLLGDKSQREAKDLTAP